VTMDEGLMFALSLAKAGYYSGDPEKVLQARVDIVLSLMQYESFRNDYQEVEYFINKPD
jgi:hypothetical protein